MHDQAYLDILRWLKKDPCCAIEGNVDFCLGEGISERKRLSFTITSICRAFDPYIHGDGKGVCVCVCLTLI